MSVQAEHTDAVVVVVMGVSGTGKSTVGLRVAEALGVDFEEGDSFHPESNIITMSQGRPLTDEDRWPWLQTLADLASERHADGRSLVMTCSALKRAYRDALRSGVPVGAIFFLHLHAAEDVLAERMTQRTEHFMPASLLTSQLETLEPLGEDENGAVVNVAPPAEDVVAAVLEVLRGRSD